MRLSQLWGSTEFKGDFMLQIEVVINNGSEGRCGITSDDSGGAVALYIAR